MLKRLIKKYNEIWGKVKTYLKKNLIVNQCIRISTLKLK